MSSLRRLVACLALSAPFAAAQEALDLPTALNLALAQNRELAQRARALRSAEINLVSARSEFRYRLRPEGSVTRTQDEERYGYGIVLGKKFGTGADLEAGPRLDWTDTDEGLDRRTGWRIDLSQPLFRNYGPLVQLEPVVQAHQRLRSARREFEQQKAELLLRVVEQFEQLIRLERQIAAETASLQRLEKLYRLTKARERQGRATRIDTLRVELRHGEARARLEANRERLSSQQRDFAELLGQPPDQQYALQPPPLLDLEMPPPEAAVALALSNRLDYAQVLQDYHDTVRGEKIARRGLWPDLSLQARYETYETSGADGDTLWSVGLAGDTDLNPTRERARLGQALLSRESAREAIRIRELAITREVQQQTSAYRRALEELALAKRNHQLADQRTKLARRLFELGRGDNFSVTDAEDALSDAIRQELTARAEASIAGYRFLNTVGLLIEAPADLRPNPSEAPL